MQPALASASALKPSTFLRFFDTVKLTGMGVGLSASCPE